MKNTLVFCLAFICQICLAQFEAPVIIDPPYPMVGDTIRVGLIVEFFPPCLLLPRENSIGETHSINVSSNDIVVNVLSDNLIICNPIPFSPASREYYDLGVLTEGKYTLNTYFTSVSGIPVEFIPSFPLPDNFPVQQYGPQLNFTVNSAPPAPQSVDMLTLQSLILMICIILSIAFNTIWKTEFF